MAYLDVVLADAPWAYWPQLETSGTSIADASGNNRHATLVGVAPTFDQPFLVAGTRGIAWPASNNSYLRFTPGFSNAAITYEAWVYLTALPGGVADIIAQGDASGGGDSTNDSGLYITTTGRVVLSVWNSTYADLTSPDPLALNTWHHVVGRIVGNVMTLRINKVTVATVGKTPSGSTRGFYVHAGLRNGAGAVTIAAPALYNKGLTDERIDAHYDAAAAKDITATPLTGLAVSQRTPYAATLTWNNVEGASRFEYQIDGGAIQPVATLRAVLTGLAPATTYAVRVRAVNIGSNTTTAWADLSITTRTLHAYDLVVAADAPVLYLPMDETTGDVLDHSPSALHFAYVSGQRGKPRVVGSGYGCIGATGVGALATRDLTPAIAALTTWTWEAWLRLPTGNIMGSFTKIGTTNGVGIGVGNTTHEDAGRKLILLLESVVWAPTGYSFPTDRLKHHVVVTRAGNVFTSYVNGVQVDQRTPGTPLAPVGALNIGSGAATSSRLLTPETDMDAVALYPTALSPARIAAHFAAGPEPVQYARLAADGRTILPATGQSPQGARPVTVWDAPPTPTKAGHLWLDTTGS